MILELIQIGPSTVAIHSFGALVNILTHAEQEVPASLGSSVRKAGLGRGSVHFTQAKR